MKKIGDIIVPRKAQININEEKEKNKQKREKKVFFNINSIKEKHTVKYKERKIEGAVVYSKQLANIRHWLLLALIFLMPLWFLPWGTDKIGLAKQLLMTTLAGIGFIIWLYESMSKGKIVYRKSAINISIWFLLLAVTISTVFSLNSITSFYSSSANFANLWNFIFLGIFYLLIISDKKKNQKIKLIDAFLFSSGIVILYSLVKLFGLDVLGGFTKTIGFNPMGTMNSVAVLAGLTFILSLGRLALNSRIRRTSDKISENLDERLNYKSQIADLNSLSKTDQYETSKLLKGILIGIALISFIFLFLVSFKIIWYGLILGAILLIITEMKGEKDVQIKSLSLPIAVLVISLVFVLWGTFGARIGIEQPKIGLKNLPTEIYPTFKTSLGIANKTLNQRSNLGQTFFGVGLGNFDKMWLLHRPLDLNQTDFWQLRFYQGYSSFTTWMVETGYLGIISMLSLFVVLLQGVKRKKESLNKLNNLYLSIPITYLVLMWFLCSFNLTLYFAFFLLIALLVRNNPKKEIDFTHPIQKALILSLVSVLVMVAMVFAGYFTIQRYISSVNASRGMAEQIIDIEGLEQKEIIAKSQEQLNKKINFLSRAYNMDKSNDDVLRTASQLYLNKINLALQGQDENISSYVQNTLVYAKTAIEVDGTEYQNYVNLAQIYENLITLANDAYGFAISNYEEALKLNPGDPAIVFSIARSQFAEAVRLTSVINSLQDQTQKEQVLETQRQLLTQAIKNLNEAITLKINYTPAYQLLAQIYDAQGKIDEAIVSRTNLVILNPQDAGLWFGLGLLYYKNDDMARAEASFVQAIHLKEDYSNARYFLGLTYSSQEKKEEAILQFERVAELNPDNQEVKTILENLRSGKKALEETN